MTGPPPAIPLRLLALLVGLSAVFTAFPCDAHSGTIAVALPLEIVIDGDFSDWPEDMTRYPISHLELGEELQDEADFRTEFRIGHDPSAAVLYLAVEVWDQAVVAAPVGERTWSSQESCEIYIQPRHGDASAPPVQYHLHGDRPGVYWDGDYRPSRVHEIAGQVRWRADGYMYEVGIDLRTSASQHPLEDDAILGFDVSMVDYDPDAGITKLAWGVVAPASLSTRTGSVICFCCGARAAWTATWT